ncbi:hypothetical protein Patl1_16839 [Pistacia atlantica]|uniref:Uncharacterized protein n=1 Tax=Pistacia atlantica TaxID=434234 RepID=A0ACC1B7W7_9ROSI|nr:hypothetical protein Patl1_16839 [Pistacia atlantica]
MVVSFEHEASELRRGDANSRDSAELEVNDGTELVSEVSENVVWPVNVEEESKKEEEREQECLRGKKVHNCADVIP